MSVFWSAATQTPEIAEKQARSIKYQMTIARLPLAKDLGDFAFDNTPINATLVHDLAGGEFLAHERNVVLVGGTGTGKSHLLLPPKDRAGQVVGFAWMNCLGDW